MSTCAIRVRDDANGFYAHARGEVISTGMARNEAEAVVNAAPNGAEWEVVPDTPTP